MWGLKPEQRTAALNMARDELNQAMIDPQMYVSSGLLRAFTVNAREGSVVNPRYPSIDGVTCYPTVADLPEAPDVGLVLLGGDSASAKAARR